MSNFDSIKAAIYEQSPLQKKRLERYLDRMDAEYFREADAFAEDYLDYLKQQDLSLKYAIEAYLKLCKDMMLSQKEFAETGTYPLELSDEAFVKVYNDETEMKYYMVGLAISQFLWETHYQMFHFFADYVARCFGKVGSYIEVGPGHGLYLKKAMDNLHPDAEVTIVDISATSLNLTDSIIQYFLPKRAGGVSKHLSDILVLDLDQRFDFITMGEVLEHVEAPDQLLLKMASMMAEDGRMFISTCVNCPTIDHVYHFKSVSEVREMMRACGLDIENERVLPVEDLPWEEIMSRKITINYCAILKGQGQ